MARRLRASSVRRIFPRLSFLAAAVPALGLASSFALGCSSGSSGHGTGPGTGTPGTGPTPVVGQTAFESSLLPGQSQGTGGAAGGAENAGAGTASAPVAAAGGVTDSAASSTRTVEETDLYRVSGNYLYYLNSYRGLMVFDITNIDQPVLVGRHSIFGTPIDMVVNNGFAVVIVSDWYGSDNFGAPFYGSIVRGLDVTDPTNIKTAGQAELGGDVVDSRVVGNVLYTVSQSYGLTYGWGGGGVSTGVAVSGGGVVGYGGDSSDVVVNSVSFANNTITPVGQKVFSGYNGVINVNANSIMLAHDVTNGSGAGTSQTALQYIDISDPGGAIALGGTQTVPGNITGWGADNGRWNLDFADEKTAHVLTQGNDGSYDLSTVDFTTPAAPTVASTLPIPSSGWSPTARFDSGRMYLSPDSYYWSNGTSATGTPIQIFDLSVPAAPKLAGQTSIPGTVWLFMPSGNQLFALGNSGDNNLQTGASVSLSYLDVTNEAQPSLIGTSNFGSGWAWSPAASTFKAFTLDTTQGLVAIPFSGWSDASYAYNNGVQLIEFTPTSIKTGGAAKTHGWVERGIFASGRLLSLSDLALTVSNYTDPSNPRVVTEVTLARNVVDATPQGATIAELSSDWWGNDTSTSEMRVLPIGQADQSEDVTNAVSATIAGTDARVYRNGDFAYVVSDVNVPAPCGTSGNGGGPSGIVVPVGGDVGGGTGTCTTLTEQVQVVDLSGGGATLRGKLALPIDAESIFGGYYWYDWFEGTDEVQVGTTSTLAFRRWNETYNPDGTWSADQKLYVLDLSNPDAPTMASTPICPEADEWWGNMQVVGSTLYTNHSEWIEHPSVDGSIQGSVRYYLDRIDLSDPKNPKIEKSFNVPGMLIGGSSTDPTILYTIDYRYDDNHPKNEFDVVQINEDARTAALVSRTPIGGWVGSVYTQGTKAYTTVTHYDWDTGPYTEPTQQLLQIDFTNPAQPVTSIASTGIGWGWLLGLAGDRALVSSGWGYGNNIDVYQLGSGAPSYEQTIRMNSWDYNSVKRQDNTLYLSTGYWGVQTAVLQ